MDLRRYAPEDLAALTAAAARAARPVVVRDDGGRWWAIDADRRWLRFEDGTWSVGRSPRAEVVGPPVDTGPAGVPARADQDWTPPDPPAAEGYEPPPEFDEPMPDVEPDASTREGREPARVRPPKGPGMRVFLGAVIAGISVVPTWTHGPWGERDGSDVPIGYLFTGDFSADGVALGTACVVLAAAVAFLAFFRSAATLTRIAGAVLVAAATVFLGRVAQAVTEAQGADLRGVDVFDVLGGGPFVLLAGGILVLVGKPGRSRW